MDTDSHLSAGSLASNPRPAQRDWVVASPTPQIDLRAKVEAYCETWVSVDALVIRKPST